MNQIKIMWISSCAPYSKAREAGGQTFNYYFKKISVNDNFDVKLISLGIIERRDEQEEELKHIDHHLIYTEKSIYSKIKKVKNIDSRFNPWNQYANLISNYCAGEILQILKRYKTNGYNPDIVIFEWTNTLVLAPQVKKIYPNAKLVASEHDVTFVGYKRKAEYYKGIKGLFWNIKYKNEKKIELSALCLCDLILPQNWDNRNILVKEGIQETRIQWLVPYFNNMTRCSRKPNEKDILFFGAMARPENYLSAIWFIENVMPLIKDMDIRFVVLGSNPADKLKQYESPRIHITGFVDSIVPYFEQAVCLVAPLVLGAGIKVKILEALSSGVPVITNDIGIEGIPAKSGKEYIHCRNPKEYENAIRSVFSDVRISEQLQEQAREFIKKNYSVDKSVDEYMARLTELGGQA